MSFLLSLQFNGPFFCFTNKQVKLDQSWVINDDVFKDLLNLVVEFKGSFIGFGQFLDFGEILLGYIESIFLLGRVMRQFNKHCWPIWGIL